MITSLIIIIMTMFIEMKDDNILVIGCLSSYLSEMVCPHDQILAISTD